jgi:hypothetical protein
MSSGLAFQTKCLGLFSSIFVDPVVDGPEVEDGVKDAMLEPAPGEFAEAL